MDEYINKKHSSPVPFTYSLRSEAFKSLSKYDQFLIKMTVDQSKSMCNTAKESSTVPKLSEISLLPGERGEILLSNCALKTS